MFDRSNTPGAVRAEDQRLIEAINDVRRRYPFSDAVAEQLLDDFTKPTGALRQWIFGLCDPAMRASPFVARDDLAAFTREVMTRGQDYNARWTDLTPKERRLARRIERFAQDKRRVWVGAGRPQNVDPSLVLYVIRRIEEATGVAFRFSRPAPLRGAAGTPGPARLGGSMLRLAEAALRRLFRFDDRLSRYLGWVSPARHYTRREIARTAQLTRRASRMSPASPANWPSDLILAFPGDVRSELAGKARQKKDQGSASPSSWSVAREALEALEANRWGIAREALEAAIANGRETRLKYGSGLDVLQANLKSGAQPDLIELSKRRLPRVDVRQEQQSASTPPRSHPMILVAERTLPEPPTSPAPSTGRTS